MGRGRRDRSAHTVAYKEIIKNKKIHPKDCPMREHAFLVCLETARLGKLPQSGYISIYCLSLLLVSFVEEKCFIYLTGLSYAKLLEFVQHNLNVILIYFLKGKPIKDVKGFITYACQQDRSAIFWRLSVQPCCNFIIVPPSFLLLLLPFMTIGHKAGHYCHFRVLRSANYDTGRLKKKRERERERERDRDRDRETEKGKKKEEFGDLLGDFEFHPSHLYVPGMTI